MSGEPLFDGRAPGWHRGGTGGEAGETRVRRESRALRGSGAASPTGSVPSPTTFKARQLFLKMTIGTLRPRARRDIRMLSGNR